MSNSRSWPKWLLGGVVAAGAAAALFFSSEDNQRETKRWAAERVGDAAAGVMQNRGVGERAADLINIPIEVRLLADSVYQARGVGNTHLIATSEGHVVFDTGLATQAAKQRRLLGEAVPDLPVTHVILSHSHQDHVGGTEFFVEKGTEIIAHEEFTEEQRYLKVLQPYFWGRNRTLFPWMPEEPPTTGFLAYGNVQPTILVDEPESYRFEQGGVRFEVLPTPGAEGADNIVLWLPDQKILFSGDFFGPIFPQFPNIFTMRGEKVRKPIEYIASLEQLIALEPEMVVPSHKDPVKGKDGIRAALIKMRDAVQYVHDETIAGMNAGKTVHQLMDEIQLPDELAMTQAHGRVSWAVKSIWEYYATWFHFDRTTELYSLPQSAILGEVVQMAGIEGLIGSARDHLEAGRPIHALHLLEIALGGQPDHRGALEARLETLRAQLEEVTPINNAYEMDWLGSRIRATEDALDREGV